MSKEEVLELIEIFDLVVDYDQWESKGWLRIKSDKYPDTFGNKNNCIIAYEEDTRDELLNIMRTELINLGRKLKEIEFKKVLNLR